MKASEILMWGKQIINVSFIVKNDEGNAIAGALVSFGSFTNIPTDSNGEVFFEDIDSGQYTYTVSTPSTNLVSNQLRTQSQNVNITSSKTYNIFLQQGFGRLYSDYILLNHASDVVPTDWRLPKIQDYIDLIRLEDPTYNSGSQDPNAGREYKYPTYYYWGNNGGNFGFDKYGFSAFGSNLGFSFKSFAYFGCIDDRYSSDTSNSLVLTSTTDSELFDFPIFTKPYSLRCIHEGTGTPTSMTDYDGNIYDVEFIAGKYWTKQNLKVTNLNNGTSIPVSSSLTDFESKAETQLIMINPGTSELTSENGTDFV